jgi:hypothetical protein
MNINEAFKILLENPNPVINKKTCNKLKPSNLPYFSPSKGGRYWFDHGMVSEDEIYALFVYAAVVSQEVISIDIPFIINFTEIDDTQHGFLCANLLFDEENNLKLPIMEYDVAEQVYKYRANGYCNFKTCKIIDGKIHAELGSELCLDELLAIYALLLDKKKQLGV